MSKFVCRRLALAATLLAGLVGNGIKYARGADLCPAQCSGTNCVYTTFCTDSGCTDAGHCNPLLYSDAWWLEYEEGSCNGGPACRSHSIWDSGYTNCGCTAV